MNKIILMPESSIKEFYASELTRLKWQGNGEGIALCPFHDDNDPSFSVKAENGVWYCHGCKANGNIDQFYMKKYSVDFKTAHNTLAELFGISGKTNDRETTFDYLNANKELMYQVVRSKPKNFWIRRPNGKDGWEKGLGSVKPIPYNLPAILESDLVFIVEGEKDVESMRRIDFVASCNPMGAGKWRKEYNQYFSGKDIIIVPDNDDVGKKHADDVANNLFSIAKSIKVISLPDLPEKGDVTDCINALKGNGKSRGYIKTYFLTLISVSDDYQHSMPEQSEIRPSCSSSYFVEDGYLCRTKNVHGIPVTVRIANFDAWITEEVIEDNGIDQQHKYRITGTRHQINLPVIDVSASQFPTLNWVHRWGTKTILEPGQGTKDFVRHAIQERSTNVKKSYLYTHTGWREIDGQWVYLHGGGAIGADNISVGLSKEMQRYKLPLRLENEAAAIKSSLVFLDIAPEEVTLPLLCLTYLAPLTTLLKQMPNFSGYIYGETGTRKTSIAALLLSHFGDFIDGQNLFNFSDTLNSLEKKAFTLKDTLMVLDDYHPSPTKSEGQYKENIAQGIIRKISNRTGRGRLNNDTTDKDRYTPQGMLLITGEELVSVPSTLARLLLFDLSRESINLIKLKELQQSSYLLSHAMYSYIDWVRGHVYDIKRRFENDFTELRQQAYQDGIHGRLPEQIAFLYFALKNLVAWLTEKNILAEKESNSLLERGWSIFLNLEHKQNALIKNDDPVERFFEIIKTLLLNNQVKLTNKQGVGDDIGKLEAAAPIGYVDEKSLYFFPTPMWHEINKFCRNEGTHFPYQKRSLYQMLRQRKLIVVDGNDNTVNIKARGKTHSVLHIADKRIILGWDEEDKSQGTK